MNRNRVPSLARNRTLERFEPATDLELFLTCPDASSRGRCAYCAAALALLLAMVGTLELSAAEATGQGRPGVGAKTVNVIVINIDPVLKTRNNLRLHQFMKWSDPWRLTDKMVEDARAASQGYVDYHVCR